MTFVVPTDNPDEKLTYSDVKSPSILIDREKKDGDAHSSQSMNVPLPNNKSKVMTSSIEDSPSPMTASLANLQDGNISRPLTSLSTDDLASSPLNNLSTNQDNRLSDNNSIGSVENSETITAGNHSNRTSNTVKFDEPEAYNNEKSNGDGEFDALKSSPNTSHKSGFRRLTQRDNIFRIKLGSTRSDQSYSEPNEGSISENKTTSRQTKQNSSNTSNQSDSNPRRDLAKLRSKSDAEVIKKSTAFDSGDESNISHMRNLSIDVHSDTEATNLNTDNDASSMRSNSNVSGPDSHQLLNGGGGTRRRLLSYIDPNNFHHSVSTGPSESAPGVFRRRISHFNTEGLSRNIRKYTLLNFARRKKEVKPEEYQKSGELLDELSSIIPATIIIASRFLRDDNGLNIEPILLKQIRFTITELRSKLFRIDLEYGSGISWSITKEYRDFSTLHSKLKTIAVQAKLAQKSTKNTKGKENDYIGGRRRNVKLPRLPKSHQYEIRRSTSRVDGITPVRTHNSTGSGWEHPSSSSSDEEVPDVPSVPSTDISARPPTLALALTQYLNALCHKFQFLTESDRILQFLEFSTMKLRLAPEQSYHGKEGRLFIRSSASVQGWKASHLKPDDITDMIQRHTSKWFLVRHSYLVCVDNASDTNIVEVFLVDKAFNVRTHLRHGMNGSSVEGDNSSDPTVIDTPAGRELSKALRFFLEIENNERIIKLAARSEREVASWVDSINKMKEQTLWSKPHRYDSFAPVRDNVNAEWFVDARDYYWSVSQAISEAKDVIYIHDWWLSPELYLRRPAQGNQEWRLDRLLKRKAEEGIKIFVIIYRNYGQTVPIDSLYTKHSLLDLHKNIYVMRSPNQWLQNTFFWAHHEKMCLIDHKIAYLGGIDLCFGRFDTSEHVLTDDKNQAFFKDKLTDPVFSSTFEDELPETQMWPGKDYSNPRVQDFHNLHDPYGEMYNREKVPRMPWHDIHMMVTGQPARDLVRHFVQRWNYVIRQKRPSRSTPLLLPPPDFTDEQMQHNGLGGTCEVQIVRSSCQWSLGLKDVEHSIQEAYVNAIEESEHFVYIENQFFVTSTTIEGIKIENKIGDALVERIDRAHRYGQNWRCVIIIPLMPGFESQVDMVEGSSVRVIMQCQFMSISRGKDSILERLDALGIEPDDYIQFFSLRKWGEIGPKKKLVTEQLYIHAKCMLVDDRLAIIGSANINERSMLGSRDSEVAAIVRDKHLIDGTMGGEPFQVGNFAHSLRVRLMSEHLGVELETVDLINSQLTKLLSRYSHVDEVISECDNSLFENSGVLDYLSFNHYSGTDNIGLREKKTKSRDNRVQDNIEHKLDVDNGTKDGYKLLYLLEGKRKKDPKNENETMVGETEAIINEAFENFCNENPEFTASNIHELKSQLYEKLVDTNVNDNFCDDELTPIEEMPRPSQPRTFVNAFKLEDPLDDDFYNDVWFAIAEKNTAIFSEVFKCQPDNKVGTWKDYLNFMSFGEKFSTRQDEESGQKVSSKADTLRAHDPLGTLTEEWATTPSGPGQDIDSELMGEPGTSNTSSDIERNYKIDGVKTRSTSNGDDSLITPAASSSSMGHTRRKKRTNTRNQHTFEPYGREEALKILKGTKGNLVLYPVDWLIKEFEA